MTSLVLSLHLAAAAVAPGTGAGPLTLRLPALAVSAEVAAPATATDAAPSAPDLSYVPPRAGPGAGPLAVEGSRPPLARVALGSTLGVLAGNAASLGLVALAVADDLDGGSSGVYPALFLGSHALLTPALAVRGGRVAGAPRGRWAFLKTFAAHAAVTGATVALANAGQGDAAFAVYALGELAVVPQVASRALLAE